MLGFPWGRAYTGSKYARNVKQKAIHAAEVGQAAHCGQRRAAWWSGTRGTQIDWSASAVIFDAFETRQLASFTDSYAYGLASRVTSWTRTGEGATQVTYGYEAAGNLDTLTRDSVTTVFTQDADNRLTLAVTGSSVTTYTNDLYGRRTSEITSEDPSATPVATTYTWDAMGHLAGVSLDDGATVCSYSYGANGMRESASVTEGATTSTTKSFWLGSALTAEVDSVGEETGTRYDYLWRSDGTPLALAVTPSGGATFVRLLYTSFFSTHVKY